MATAVREIGLDQRPLPTPVSIIEVLGRNTGWLQPQFSRGSASTIRRILSLFPNIPLGLGSFWRQQTGYSKNWGGLWVSSRRVFVTQQGGW